VVDVGERLIDSTAANVGHVQPERESWKCRNATDADQGSRWRRFPFHPQLPREDFLYLLTVLPYVLQSQVRLRLRLSYLINGQQIQDQVDFFGFPQNLTTGAQ